MGDAVNSKTGRTRILITGSTFSLREMALDLQLRHLSVDDQQPLPDPGRARSGVWNSARDRDSLQTACLLAQAEIGAMCSPQASGKGP